MRPNLVVTRRSRSDVQRDVLQPPQLHFYSPQALLQCDEIIIQRLVRIRGKNADNEFDNMHTTLGHAVA
jgi:hypothetical protein